MKNQKGVSLIALVITIIVVIILAAIAFNSSTSTIEKANYSKFVSNIGEVRDAFKKSATEFKGDQAAIGNEITDAQSYKTIAEGKDGTQSGDITPIGQLTQYTIIDGTKAEKSIGIKLPTIKVNTPNASNYEVTYAVTYDGQVFVWPPYKYEDKYYLNDTLAIDKTTYTALTGNTSSITFPNITAAVVLESSVNGPLTNSTTNAGLTY